jgi:hypothetical protein
VNEDSKYSGSVNDQESERRSDSINHPDEEKPTQASMKLFNISKDALDI